MVAHPREVIQPLITLWCSPARRGVCQMGARQRSQW